MKNQEAIGRKKDGEIRELKGGWDREVDLVKRQGELNLDLMIKLEGQIETNCRIAQGFKFGLRPNFIYQGVQNRNKV